MKNNKIIDNSKYAGQAKPKYTIFVSDKTHHASKSDVNWSSAPGWVFDFYGGHSSMDYPPLSSPFYYFLNLEIPQNHKEALCN